MIDDEEIHPLTPLIMGEGDQVLEFLRGQGYTPGGALSALCAAVATLFIDRGEEVFLAESFNDIASAAFQYRERELKERVQ